MHPMLEQALSRHGNEFHALCASLEVKQLCVFGSARGDAFDPATSDVDFVVEFERNSEPGIADRYMNLALGLESIFKRPVDLLTRNAIRNSIFKEVVDKTQVEIYAN